MNPPSPSSTGATQLLKSSASGAPRHTSGAAIKTNATTDAPRIAPPIRVASARVTCISDRATFAVNAEVCGRLRVPYPQTSVATHPARLCLARPVVWRPGMTTAGDSGVDESHRRSADRRKVSLPYRPRVVSDRFEAASLEHALPCGPAQVASSVDRQMMTSGNEIHFGEHQLAVPRDRVDVHAAADERPGTQAGRP